MTIILYMGIYNEILKYTGEIPCIFEGVMLYHKIRTKLDVNYEDLSKSTIEGSKTPQNEKVCPMVHTTAPEILKIVTQLRIAEIKMISRSWGFIQI